MLLYELIMKTILALFIFLYINYSYANNLGSETKLDLPRYVSLKSSESNLRVGPSKNYPILIKFIVSDYPLKIVEEFICSSQFWLYEFTLVIYKFLFGGTV